MLFIYPAIFHKEDGEYWVEFPDLEGCQSYGKDIIFRVTKIIEKPNTKIAILNGLIERIEADSEIVVLLHKAVGVSLRAHIYCDSRFSPNGAHSAPADSHGVEAFGISSSEQRPTLVKIFKNVYVQFHVVSPYKIILIKLRSFSRF